MTRTHCASGSYLPFSVQLILLGKRRHRKIATRRWASWVPKLKLYFPATSEPCAKLDTVDPQHIGVGEVYATQSTPVCTHVPLVLAFVILDEARYRYVAPWSGTSRVPQLGFDLSPCWQLVAELHAFVLSLIVLHKAWNRDVPSWCRPCWVPEPRLNLASRFEPVSKLNLCHA